jgi:hypothetical protein
MGKGVFEQLTGIASGRIDILAAVVCALAFAAVAFTAGGMCIALVAPRRGAVSACPARVVHYLAIRDHRLSMLLFACALVMTCGLFQDYSIRAWAVSAYAWGKDNQVEVVSHKLVWADVSLAGILYSLSLAAMYLPAVYIMQRRACEAALMARVWKSQAEIDKWLGELGFVNTTKIGWPKILAIVTPALSGPIANVVFGLSGK